eukprot:CAMPEP_0170512320 /NCGR_PEP_ID=MMETSP0208-20121228/66786_1 /TAXON_ID=197538 /ORGANISM="Strombidium inclinatum, Strain S3" /LENGTH=140 /DNA_ID=CAMNT_0010795939 /DNA_START=2089 /DNA_END=2511 /DNA_ORIENTATION=+
MTQVVSDRIPRLASAVVRWVVMVVVEEQGELRLLGHLFLLFLLETLLGSLPLERFSELLPEINFLVDDFDEVVAHVIVAEDFDEVLQVNVFVRLLGLFALFVVTLRFHLRPDAVHYVLRKMVVLRQANPDEGLHEFVGTQ